MHTVVDCMHPYFMHVHVCTVDLMQNCEASDVGAVLLLLLTTRVVYNKCAFQCVHVCMYVCRLLN